MRDYAGAFRDYYGVDVEALPAEEALARMRPNPALAAPVAAALDDWTDARRNLGEDASSWKPLVTVARGLDPDPLRDRLRAAWGRKVTPELQDELRRLAESIDVKAQRPATLTVLAKTLNRAKLVDAAHRALQDGQYAYPADFWLNFDLGNQLRDQKDYAGEVRYFSVAVSLRPDSMAAHNNLGAALADQKKPDEAVAEFRQVIALDPKLALAHFNLGNSLRDQGKPDEAVAEFRQAIALDPKYAPAHFNLGNSLRDQGKPDEAVAEYREAIRLKKDYAEAHNNLGIALYDLGRLDEAVAEYREAIRLKMDYAQAHYNLGVALRDQGKLDEAVAEYREAIRLNFAEAHWGLAVALGDKGDLDGAVAEWREAIRLKKPFAEIHNNVVYKVPRLMPVKFWDFAESPLQPRLRPAKQGGSGRGHRRVPRGHPPQEGLRRGPQQPRQRPARQGPAGRGHRRVPRGHPPQ